MTFYLRAGAHPARTQEAIPGGERKRSFAPLRMTKEQPFIYARAFLMGSFKV